MQVESNHHAVLDKDFNLSANIHSKNKLDDCVQEIAEKEGYISYDVCKKNLDADGGSYLGLLSEIDIKGQTKNGYKETAIFCKRMSSEAIDMGFMSLANVYKVELFAYKDLSKTFRTLQDDANIPINERFNTVKCYDQSWNEVLLLENLARQGFKTWYRMDVVTLNMAEVCIKQLARFHGLSFVLKNERPDYFNKNIKNTKTPFIFGEKWNAFSYKFMKMGLDHLDEGVRTRVEHKLEIILSKFAHYNQDNTAAYCLCHGDFRPNNIMIREENGEVVKAVPVDFQLMFYSCPVYDFIYYMYMATDYEFRKAHMNHLKNVYYDSLDAFLQYYDIAVETVFPREVFEKLYKERLDYGLMTVFFYGPFLFVADDDEIPDVTTKSVADIEFKFDPRFSHRVGSAVQEFIDLGYF